MDINTFIFCAIILAPVFIFFGWFVVYNRRRRRRMKELGLDYKSIMRNKKPEQPQSKYIKSRK